MIFYNQKKVYITFLMFRLFSLPLLYSTVDISSDLLHISKDLEVVDDSKDVYEYLSSSYLSSLKGVTSGDLDKVDVSDETLKTYVKELGITYNIFTGTICKNIINDNVLYDLNFFSGSKEKPTKSLFAVLDKTQTVAGTIQLQKKLLPSDDINKLRNNQNIIRKLVSDKTLFNSLNEEINSFKEAESNLLWFWKDFEKGEMDYFEKIYFKKLLLNKLNNYSTAMELKAFHDIYGVMFNTLQGQIKGLVISASFGFFLRNYFIQPSVGFVDHLQDMMLSQVDPRTLYNIVKPSYPNVAYFLLFMGVTGIFMEGWDIYSDYKEGKERLKFVKQIQDKFKDLTTCMSVCSSLFKEIEPHKEFLNLETINDARSQLDSNSIKLKKLFNLLDSGKSSTWKDRGKALVAFKMMQELKDNFISFIKFIGEVDAYLSIAKLYKQREKNEDAKYCFVDYLEEDKPHFEIEGFWHPELDPNSVVTNDVELGEKNRSIILTGPNAAGKSTILKAIAINLILAQSFGIAAATQMSLTPFSLINTYLNIADATGEKSLYQAEIERAMTLIKAIKNLKENEFSFIIMDELLTGTNPEEGAEGAYLIMKLLSQQENNLSINATHFVDKLSKLEKDTKGVCKNKKVFVNRDEEGDILYPYKLKDGVTKQFIAEELLRKTGILDL